MQPVIAPRWRSGTTSTERSRSAATDAATPNRSSMPASTVTTGSPVCAARSAIERLTERSPLSRSPIAKLRETTGGSSPSACRSSRKPRSARGQLDRGVDHLVEDALDVRLAVEPARQREQPAQVRRAVVARRAARRGALAGQAREIRIGLERSAKHGRRRGRIAACAARARSACASRAPHRVPRCASCAATSGRERRARGDRRRRRASRRRRSARQERTEVGCRSAIEVVGRERSTRHRGVPMPGQSARPYRVVRGRERSRRSVRVVRCREHSHRRHAGRALPRTRRPIASRMPRGCRARYHRS